MCAQIPILHSFPDHFKALRLVENVCPALTGSLGVLNGCVCGGAGVGSGTVWGCCSRKVWGRAGGGGLQSLQSCEPGPGRVSAVLSDCFPSSLRSPPPGAPELRRQAEPCPGLSCGPARNRPGSLLSAAWGWGHGRNWSSGPSPASHFPSCAL